MTNHIEEMMRTAGIEKNYCENCDQVVNIDCLLYGCDKQGYPAFTAEKQLEVIKLIGFSDYSISIYEKGRGAISVAVEPNTFKYSYSAHAQDFTQTLAELTTELMKANELDKEKVKGILEDGKR